MTSIEISEAGVYDIPAEVYHADPVPGGSLSSSGARRLLPPSCPAKFAYERENPPTPTNELDLGQAAHKEVLGIGPELVVVDADDWRSKAARTERDEARAAGAVPLLPDQHEQIQAMAKALREHDVASKLFAPESGRPEQSLFWIDRPTGVWRRARLDWLRTTPGRLIVPDYKTCAAADPESIQRSVHRHGYHQQAAWYVDGVRALSGRDDVAFLLVFQEKTPPYLVTVAELGPMALRIGRDRNRQALQIYAECQKTGRWPGYADDIEQVQLPGWVENAYLQEIAS